MFVLCFTVPGQKIKIDGDLQPVKGGTLMDVEDEDAQVLKGRDSSVG